MSFSPDNVEQASPSNEPLPPQQQERMMNPFPLFSMNPEDPVQPEGANRGPIYQKPPKKHKNQDTNNVTMAWERPDEPTRQPSGAMNIYDVPTLSTVPDLNCSFANPQNCAQCIEITHHKVTFRYSGSGDQVYLTGSFFNWDMKMAMLRSAKGDCSLCLVLPAGHHEFKFIVDRQWLTSSNYPTITNRLGQLNNLIHVHPISYKTHSIAASRKTSY